VKAIAAAGAQRVAEAVTDAIAPFRAPSGAYSIANTWRYAIATA
jgi:hypothetical protein